MFVWSIEIDICQFRRTDLDLTTRQTIWNCLLGMTVMWGGYVGLNQSCVQRIVALPSINHARRYRSLFNVFIIISASSTPIIIKNHINRQTICDSFISFHKNINFICLDLWHQATHKLSCFLSFFLLSSASKCLSNNNLFLLMWKPSLPYFAFEWNFDWWS